MTTRSNGSPPLQEFAASLGARDPKTIATYLTTVEIIVGKSMTGEQPSRGRGGTRTKHAYDGGIGTPTRTDQVVFIEQHSQHPVLNGLTINAVEKSGDRTSLATARVATTQITQLPRGGPPCGRQDH